jgi:predicted ribosomally synthesized peptide with nif11-like leader
MSMSDAQAFLDRAETDQEFTVAFDELKGDQGTVLAKARGAGYDVTQDELVDAWMDRYGAELTPEQLDKIGAGGG